MKWKFKCRYARNFLHVLISVGAFTLSSCETKQRIVLSPSPSLTPLAKPIHAFEVHGHRGARARFPENTLPAFQEALSAGADAIELDMNVTADGVVVVSHDRWVDAHICELKPGLKLPPNIPSPPRGPLIHDLTLAQIKYFDCGTKKNRAFPLQQPVPGTEMPTLDEVFRFFDDSELPRAQVIRFNIETKIDPHFPNDTVDPVTFTEGVLAIVTKHHLLNRVILESFDKRTLIEARKREPSLQTSYLIEDKKIDMANAARELGATYISPDYNLLTNANVHAIHEAGALVLPWTVNRPDEWARLIHLGVDGILTDDPRDLINFLK